ncbi:MAG: RsmB/NOP family class I SAM-dependent RNA methyltransferase [Eubacterium sp.]|nr:RsmB/NOP family class I SAM-dependent RNA methyltransferase [Eubacterium sp.]
MNLPEDYRCRMKEILQDEYETYIDSFGKNYGQTLRVNRLKTEPADFIRRFLLKEQVPWCEEGFYYDGEDRLSAHPYYYGGVYYLQEPSAMAPAVFLPVKPGDRVLDLCAAPGGKSTALGAKLQGTGFLLANDISASRCKALLKNMEMAGITNSLITCETPEKLADRFPGYFDKVLVDAPCSGEGMFRRDPSMAKSWSAKEVGRYSRLQKDILLCAAKMVKPGGYLLYSTCTFSGEEDEQSVEYFLDTCPEFTLMPLPDINGVEKGRPDLACRNNQKLESCRRFWPHKLKGEGHFAALFCRKGEPGAESCGQIENFSGEIPEEMEKFFQENGIWKEGNWRDRLFFIKEKACLLPEDCPDFKGLRVIRSGLYLGDCRKKRFEPSQALAMALCVSACKNVLSFSPKDIRVDKYLRGETIEAGEETKEGWVLICVDEFPLGWGKCSRGKIKNKYNPGWRKM